MPGEIEANPTHGSNSRGFTLIELLAVISVVTVILVALSYSIRGGETSVGMINAQALCSSMVTAARAQAATSNERVRLAFAADPGDTESYLRRMFIVKMIDGDPVIAGDGALIPEPTAIVPPDNVPTLGETVWPEKLKSVFYQTDRTMQVQYDGKDLTCWYFEFTPRGTISLGGRIVISSVSRRAEGVLIFPNPMNSVGLTVSRYGIQTLISGADGFQ